tara:strand:+ start:272 stop:811 length:540 start_codon:yes stop_codon:yes gene_type:complete
LNKKLKNKLKRNIRVIPDFPKKGILFQDITSITDNKLLFKEVVDEIATYVKKNKFTKIAAVEARGFIFGSAVSYKTEIPFVPIRKKGKLPGKVIKQKYKLEYGTDEIQIHRNSINEKDKVLVIDDLIATGGTAFASANLIKKCRAKSIEFYFLIDLENVGGSRKLSKSYNVNSLINAKG